MLSVINVVAVDLKIIKENENLFDVGQMFMDSICRRLPVVSENKNCRFVIP